MASLGAKFTLPTILSRTKNRQRVIGDRSVAMIRATISDTLVWRRMPIDLRDGIICAGLRKADQATWNTTLEMYRNSTDEKEKAAILKGLGCVQSEEIIETFLQLSLDDKAVINIFDAMNTICQNNPGSFDLLLDFMRNNFEVIRKKWVAFSALLLCHHDATAERLKYGFFTG